MARRESPPDAPPPGDPAATETDHAGVTGEVTPATAPSLPTRIGDIAVGDVIDGWTVQAINSSTDVLVAQGAERRTLTVQDLERAKAATP